MTSQESLVEKEQRLRAQLLQMKQEKEARAAREVRFPEMKDHRAEQEAAQRTKEAYYADFDVVRGNIGVDGAWSRHYNNDSNENRAFKQMVDYTRLSLQDYIRSVVGNATIDSLDFSPGDTTNYPGQKSTFRLLMSTFYNDSRFKDMTMAGGVYDNRIVVFHAGPGS